MKRRNKRILIGIPIFFAVLFFIVPFGIKTTLGEDGLNVGKGIVKQFFGMEVDLNIPKELGVASKYNKELDLDKSIKGFEEIGESLGTLGESNNLITLKGLATFDANGDGLQDLFIPHAGRTIGRPNDKNGVLQMNDLVEAKPCALFLNQGNDANGNPIFKSIQDLIAKKQNNQYTEEELLIENKYQPRKSIDDDAFGAGRISQGALTADFNGDGTIDLLVLNSNYGIPFSVPGLGLRIYPGANHLGRQDKDDADYIETNLPPFLKGDLTDGSTQDFQGEPEALNTLFLNMGDKDKDGIPEWKNATKEAGINTNYTSAGGSVADIDRDGDLDFFVANFIDPDFWGFGMTKFPGYSNTLWINQLAETGELTFVESAMKFGVSGNCDTGIIDCSIPLPNGGTIKSPNDYKFKGQKIGNNSTHSWAAIFADLNNDNFPDLIVANDVPNRIEAYLNVEGKNFEYINTFDDPKYIGCWMGIGMSDYNKDGKNEFLITNCGSATYSIRNTSLFLANKNELNTASLCQLNSMNDKSTISHMMLSFEGNSAQDITKQINVDFNEFTAPDVAQEKNIHPMASKVHKEERFASSITGAEFSWSPSIFDIENDGDQDIYMVGSLNRGNDNFIGDWSAGVGRMLINDSSIDRYQFEDRTYEYKLFDIKDLDYNSTPPRKKSPGTGWHKEDFVHFSDRDSYSGQGYKVSLNSEIKDIFRMHESANANIASDLNNDGKVDVIVTHGGGYSSLSPAARNLKVDVLGKTLAVPPPNKVVKALTTWEDGPTFMYINKEENDNNFVKIELKNESSTNPFAIGAKIVVNGNIHRQLLLGGRNLSMNMEPIHVGLGPNSISTVEVIWPDGSTAVQIFNIGKEFNNKKIVLNRNGDISTTK